QHTYIRMCEINDPQAGVNSLVLERFSGEQTGHRIIPDEESKEPSGIAAMMNAALLMDDRPLAGGVGQPFADHSHRCVNVVATLSTPGPEIRLYCDRMAAAARRYFGLPPKS
ncbi:MAG: hypothetical protein OXC95_17335, partial [Dehalococcoidia bacterium]|nr:hypothetical protein [Dehalococcoidia bacterium]